MTWLKPPSPEAIAQVRRDIQAGVTYPDRWPERKHPAKATKKRQSGAQSATKQKGH